MAFIRMCRIGRVNRVEAALPSSTPDRPVSAVRRKNSLHGPCHNRVEGSRTAPPLPLHRTYGSRIRRYINCKSISDFIEIVCKGVNKSRINRDFPLAF